MIKISRDEIIEHANNLREEYAEHGLKLTVRQIYYQFVARGLLGSGKESYTRVVNALSKARLSGRFPLDGVEDRVRRVIAGKFTRRDNDIEMAEQTARERIQGLPEELLAFDRWWDQPIHVSVWVEKEALAGVFESPCYDLGVSMFACKGYPSLSSLYDWLKKTRKAMYVGAGPKTKEFSYRNIDIEFREMHEGRAEKAVILYFGDHDPDGFGIPRTAAQRLEQLQDVMGGRPVPIEFKRVALTMDQIRETNAPPFEAKVTSTRYQSYVDEHDTNMAWELDALDPAVLRSLIREKVNEHFDESIHEANTEQTEHDRDQLRELMLGDRWLRDVLEDPYA